MMFLYVSDFRSTVVRPGDMAGMMTSEVSAKYGYLCGSFIWFKQYFGGGLAIVAKYMYSTGTIVAQASRSYEKGIKGLMDNDNHSC